MNFKETPFYNLTTDLVGFITKQTETQIDNNFLSELNEAIEAAHNSDITSEELIDKIFDALEWGANNIPVLQKTVIDNLILGLVESTIKGLFGIGSGTLITAIKARRKLKRDKRKAKNLK